MSASFVHPGFECRDDEVRSFLANDAGLVGPATTNVFLDPIELRYALQCFVGDRRLFGDGAVIEAAAHMRSAASAADVAQLSERAIAHVAIDLEGASEAGKVRGRLRRCPVRRINIGDRQRVRAAPRTVVSRVRSKLPVFFALGRIEHGRHRLVRE